MELTDDVDGLAITARTWFPGDVLVRCGQCSRTETMQQGGIGPEHVAPRCACGRFDWRDLDDTPLPFQLPEVEIAVRGAQTEMACGLLPCRPGMRFKSTDSFTITGHGNARVIGSLPDGVHPRSLHGRVIYVDGIRCHVRRVEWDDRSLSRRSCVVFITELIPV